VLSAGATLGLGGAETTAEGSEASGSAPGAEIVPRVLKLSSATTPTTVARIEKTTRFIGRLRR
jgi:hypothetical protein